MGDSGCRDAKYSAHCRDCGGFATEDRQEMVVVAQYILLFVFTVVAYVISVWLYRRSHLALLHPLISSSVMIIVLLVVLRLPYETFREATAPIDFMLGPSVVALGWALYNQIEHLKAHYASILTSVVVGSLVGILSVVGVMRLFGTSAAVEASIVPKSVTTPIAIQIAERSGGVLSLTAVIVILTGIFGSIVAPYILRRLRVTDAVARGLAMGSAAHGVGTARAMELGAVEGAISGLAIGLMGLATTLLVPLVSWVISLF